MKLPTKRLKNSVFTSSECNQDDLAKGWEIIKTIASKYGWLGYDLQFEIVSRQQMLEMSSSMGLPITYNHWSFGQRYEEIHKAYKNGQYNPAYEMVINSDPSICYIMEDNSMLMQLIVLSHAGCGHNFMFKNNYLFKNKTDARGIVGFLAYAKRYIQQCEERYGEDKVEEVLDHAHILQQYSYSRSDKKHKKVSHEERMRQRADFVFSTYDPELDSKTLTEKIKENIEIEDRYIGEENILYFLQKKGDLDDWAREVIYIVRTINQYFYPQIQTKMLHEGFASFVHYTLVNELYDLGYINDSYMHEFIHNHTSVCHQPELPHGGDPAYGINPYYLGLRIFQDIKRICTNPTDEDKQCFPTLVNTDWVQAVNYAATNFKDDSFVYQYLSPKLVRDLKLFTITGKEEDPKYRITSTHSREDFKIIRAALAEQYNALRYLPYFEVEDYDNQSLYLRLHYDKTQYVKVDDNFANIELAIEYLWGRGTVMIINKDILQQFQNKLAEGPAPGIFVFHLRCRACDEVLTDDELRIKNDQGVHEDMCKKCIKSSEGMDVDPVGEDLGDVTLAAQFKELVNALGVFGSVRQSNVGKIFPEKWRGDDHGK